MSPPANGTSIAEIATPDLLSQGYAMATQNVLKTIKDNEVEFVDLRFADMLGKQHHVSFPAHAVDDSTFEDGKMFDGSSISGWKGINESDMVLMPDPASAVIDPFAAHKTLLLQ